MDSSLAQTPGHNGSAPDLKAVVDFYSARFAIGLTPQQGSDLVAFLNTL